jgi:arylsulfatase
MLDTLEEMDILDETLIVFTGDHGELLGDFNACQKMSPYESSVRVPLLMRWPERLDAGRVRRSRRLHGPLPHLHGRGGHGHPVLDELPGRACWARTAAACPSLATSGSRATARGASRWLSLRRPGVKYNCYCDNGFEELYDLDADPTEAHNLLLEGADGARATANEMRARLVEWERRTASRRRRLRATSGTSCSGARPLRRNNQFPHWVDYAPEEVRGRLEPPGRAIEEALAREDSFDIEELDLTFFKEARRVVRGAAGGRGCWRGTEHSRERGACHPQAILWEFVPCRRRRWPALQETLSAL